MRSRPRRTASEPDYAEEKSRAPLSRDLRWALRARREYAHGFDPVLARVEDLDRIVGDRDARAGLGDRLELLDDQAVQRFRAVRGQVPVHHAIQLAHVRARVDDVAAVALFRHADVHGAGE